MRELENAMERAVALARGIRSGATAPSLNEAEVAFEHPVKLGATSMVIALGPGATQGDAVAVRRCLTRRGCIARSGFHRMSARLVEARWENGRGR